MLLKQRCLDLGAIDLAERVATEEIYYSNPQEEEENLFHIGRIRLFGRSQEVDVTIKDIPKTPTFKTKEIELRNLDLEEARQILLAEGLKFERTQQQLIHAFILRDSEVSFRSWPPYPGCRIVEYVEIEGEDVKVLEKAVKELGLDWSKRDVRNPREILESFGIPYGSLTLFTFDKIEPQPVEIAS